MLCHKDFWRTLQLSTFATSTYSVKFSLYTCIPVRMNISLMAKVVLCVLRRDGKTSCASLTLLHCLLTRRFRVAPDPLVENRRLFSLFIKVNEFMETLAFSGILTFSLSLSPYRSLSFSIYLSIPLSLPHSDETASVYLNVVQVAN